MFTLHGLAMDNEGQILGHVPGFDGFDADALELMGENPERFILINLCSELESPGPGKDRGNGIRGGLAALLMFTVMTGDGSMGGLSLTAMTIRGQKDRGHESQGAIALGDDIRLDISIIVLTGPDKTTRRLEHLSDHVVDKAMLVPDLFRLELRFVLAFIDLLEDVLEPSVVFLQNGVFGRHVEGIVLIQRDFEARMGESCNGLKQKEKKLGTCIPNSFLERIAPIYFTSSWLYMPMATPGPSKS